MKIWLRSSLLDEDCDRRLAAKQWRKVIVERDGYEVRRLGNHIAAARGRANHRVFESQLKFKRDTGITPDYQHGVENALNKMDEEVAELGSIIVDATTPDRRTAAEQVLQTAREFNRGYLAYHEPKLTEEELAIWSDDSQEVMLTTTLDHLTSRGALHDFKTGARKPEAPMQLGLQALIAQASGESVKEAGLVWLPPKGEMEIIPYDLKVIKDEANARIDQIVRDYRTYGKERSLQVFRANVKSMSCGAAWCPIYGTPSCPLKQGEKVDG